MIKASDLTKHFERSQKEFPLVLGLLTLASSTCAIMINAWWPVLWMIVCLAMVHIDLAIMGQFKESKSPTKTQLVRAEYCLMASGFFAVCIFLTLPIMLLAQSRFDVIVIAMAMFAVGATRSASMFSMSNRIGLACYLPYLIGLTATLIWDGMTSPANEIFGHVVAVLALCSCLGYIWLAWLKRYQAEQALDVALSKAESQRDAAARDATVSRLLFKHTSLRAALLDGEGRFIAVNAAWLGAIQKTEAELIGYTMQEAMPYAKAGWVEAFDASKSGKTTIVEGDATIRADGKQVYLDWQVQPWFNDDGSYGGAVGYAQDVTEVYVARAAAKAKQDRLALALKANKSFIWEIDYLAKTATFDQDAVDFYGQEPTFDMISKREKSLTHPDDREISKLQAKRLGENGGYGRMEAREIRADGSIKWVRSDVAPLKITNGVPTSFVLLTSDITEEMKRHERLAEMMVRANVALSEKRKILAELCGDDSDAFLRSSLTPADLISDQPLAASDSTESTFTQLFAGFDQILTEIDERDTALAAAVQQLRAARTSAETANIAKSQFLANMSHELRTPLNAIIGYTEILIEDSEYEGRDEAAKDAHKVRTSATHLLRLINEILDLSKIEAGKMDIVREATPLTDVLTDIMNSGAPLATLNGNRLIIEVDSDRTLALTDGFRLRQCLLNLVSNACKFTENGEITIGLNMAETADNQRWFDISVQDTGIGISEEQILRLFRPFSQADGSTTRKYGGTGLGLALTRELVQLLGGDVSVTSEVDVGSKFTIRIPALGLDAEDVAITYAADESAALVLVVDDDPIARALTARSAAALGMSVASAETGRAALAFCEQNDVSLIVLDLQLPDMNGHSILAVLRNSERTRHTPVMIVSVDDDRRASISAGAQEHLAKPCPAAVLTAAMARLARRKNDGHMTISKPKPHTTTPDHQTQIKLGVKSKRSA